MIDYTPGFLKDNINGQYVPTTYLEMLKAFRAIMNGSDAEHHGSL